jgi:hypothetical protein
MKKTAENVAKLNINNKYIPFFLLGFIFSSCNNNEPTDRGIQNSTTDNTTQTEVQDIPPEDTETEAEETNTPYQEIAGTLVSEGNILKHSIVKDSDGIRKYRCFISSETIDSLNAITPIYDAAKYSGLSVSYFTALADSMHGQPFFANNADSVIKSIMEILTTRLNDGTDIVFLIDKTGSMRDDIEVVRKSLTIIKDYLSNFKNVKIGMAAYGDKNWHYDFWYNSVGLTSNIEEIKTFMDGYTTFSNPDIPESVNDGIVKTIEEMNWTPGNKRLLMVIGDAESQKPPFSNYSASEVIKKCDSLNVQFNLYPIIIACAPSTLIYNQIDKDFAKLYPNPANEFCKLNFSKQDHYNCVINDMSGRELLRTNTYDESLNLNLTSIPSGVYLISVSNDTLTKFFSQPLVIQH